MTPAIRQAIHEHTLRASLEFRLREGLQYILLTAVIWVEMTVCLVWHWTGHYGGAAAHRYFIRWFLAWFLTQEIPLTIASLPYRGGRYTITSMYAFSITSITSAARSLHGIGIMPPGAQYSPV